MWDSPPILLLDTNVWLDIFIPHRPGREAALDLVAEAEEQGVALAYPSQAILDVYQRVRSNNKAWIRQSRPLTQTDSIAVKRMTWDFVNTMRCMATAIPVDTNDISLACHFRDIHDDLEDDLILAACQRARATYLVTTDSALLRHAPIEARSPSEMTELLRSGRARGASPSKEAANATDWLYRWLAEYEGKQE